MSALCWSHIFPLKLWNAIQTLIIEKVTQKPLLKRDGIPLKLLSNWLKSDQDLENNKTIDLTAQIDYYDRIFTSMPDWSRKLIKNYD